MKKSLKTISLFLALLFLFLSFTGCEGKVDSDADSVIIDEERKDKLDIVPLDVKFEGEVFNILCRNDSDFGEYTYEIISDGESGDYVDKAVYERNKKTEERFGIKISTTPMPGHSEVKDDFIATMKDSILSGKGEYDLIMGQSEYLADCNLFSCYTDMYDVPYIKDDIHSDYFYQSMIDEISYNGKLFFVCGDYCLSCLKSTNVMFFNKTLAGEELTEDIYNLVNQGKWSVNNVIDMSIGYYRDLNGNGISDNNDRYGYVSNIVNSTDAWFSCFDAQPTQKIDGDNIILNLDQGKMADIIYKMNSFFKTNDVYSYYLNSTKNLNDNPEEQIFEKNHALFFSSTLERAENYRNKNINFGIVPLPKWTEAQDNYYTQARNDYSIAIIPSDADNLKMSGAVLDVLMAESKQVVRAYLDTVIYNGTERDDTMDKMLKIITDGLRFNFGYFYYDNMRIGGIIRYLINNDNDYFISYYSANQRSYEKNLNRILEKYKN
ncbi:MAG: hypothetical protein PUB34_01390 [Clostridia bacterium]|nr:hypothetical protein [Clostridia bacterium]